MSIAYEVGRPWPGDPEVVAQPGFGWHPDVCTVLLVRNDLSPEEITGLTGSMEIAVGGRGHLVVLMIRLDGWGWMESPVWRRFSDLPVELMPGPSTDRSALTLVTVADGLVAAIRLVTLSPHLTKALRQEVAHRWDAPLDDAQGLAEVGEWYDNHPTLASSLQAMTARARFNR